MGNKASSRSGLFLMELIISILFFSLAGAVCVRLFVDSHITSQNSVELNYALEWSQNVAEVFYGCNGHEEEMVKVFDNICFDTKENADSEFYLLFDEKFLPIPLTDHQKAGNLSNIDYTYFMTVDISSEKEMILCHMRADKALSGEGEFAKRDAIYELSITLFPRKEAASEN